MIPQGGERCAKCVSRGMDQFEGYGLVIGQFEGRGFSPYIKLHKILGLTGCGKTLFRREAGASTPVKPTESMRALAPERCDAALQGFQSEYAHHCTVFHRASGIPAE